MSIDNITKKMLSRAILVGLNRTSRPVRKSGKLSKSGLSGNWPFSLPDAGLLKIGKK